MGICVVYGMNALAGRIESNGMVNYDTRDETRELSCEVFLFF